jgi:hypothetical protein
MHCKLLEKLIRILLIFGIGHFIESIQHELQGLSTSIIVFVPRECNSAAHVLANEAVANNVDSVWLEDIPRSISGIVIREQVVPKS